MIHPVQQRSVEWYALRTGRITGTSFATMANGTKAAIEKLCWEVATERHTGRSVEKPYINEAMQRGIDMEDEARRAFELDQFLPVEEVGFVSKDDLLGVSPDGLIDDWGGLEIKCPQPETHFQYLREGRRAWKGSYWWQVQGGLWVTGRSLWYFVSYCPEFPAGETLFIDEVGPDAKAFEKLEEGAEFCRERTAEILGTQAETQDA
jgi:hypothetical protein